LALSHPMVYVSFGCHPKAAWSYDDKMEAKILACIEECGSKCLSYGEFGLDYSHPFFGPHAGNRRTQKAVFVRQLKIAIARGMPLVARALDIATLLVVFLLLMLLFLWLFLLLLLWLSVLVFLLFFLFLLLLLLLLMLLLLLLFWFLLFLLFLLLLFLLLWLLLFVLFLFLVLLMVLVLVLELVLV
ncbi:unnamed protein product, partial [Polarella glacialis]